MTKLTFESVCYMLKLFFCYDWDYSFKKKKKKYLVICKKWLGDIVLDEKTTWVWPIGYRLLYDCPKRGHVDLLSPLFMRGTPCFYFVSIFLIKYLFYYTSYLFYLWVKLILSDFCVCVINKYPTSNQQQKKLC